MSIERLNKAATAAGYAMATPDDEAPATTTDTEASIEQSRALVVAEEAPRLLSADAATSITNWVKGHLSGFGWRQPA